MKILLYNQNPVVEKLVTLSAKKTSDEIINIRSVDELIEEDVDLLLVDDDAFIIDENCYDMIKEKIKFKKSCLIASRDGNSRNDFDDILYKPFLPTDLVAELEKFSEETKNMAVETVVEEEAVIDGLDLETTHVEKDEIEEEVNLDGLLGDDEQKKSETLNEKTENEIKPETSDETVEKIDTPIENEVKINSETECLTTENEVNLDLQPEIKVEIEPETVNDKTDEVKLDDSDDLVDLETEKEISLDSDIDNAIAELDAKNSDDEEFASFGENLEEDKDMEQALAELDSVEAELNSFLDSATSTSAIVKEEKVEEVSEPEIETKSEPKAEEVSEPEIETKPESKVEEVSEPEIETKPEPKAEEVSEPEIETKPESKVEEVSEPEIETKPEPKAEEVSEPEIETKPEPKVEEVSEPEIETKPEPKVEKVSEFDSLDSLSETEVGKVLGEDIPEPEPKEETISVITPVPIPVPLSFDKDEKSEVKDEVIEKKPEIKKEVAGDLETIMTLLKQLDSVGLKKVLNGMKLNISISFEDTTGE